MPDDPQMKDIRELFEAAEGTGFSRESILRLAESRVAELIDRLPPKPWPVSTGNKVKQESRVTKSLKQVDRRAGNNGQPEVES